MNEIKVIKVYQGIKVSLNEGIDQVIGNERPQRRTHRRPTESPVHTLYEKYIFTCRIDKSNRLLHNTRKK